MRCRLHVQHLEKLVTSNILNQCERNEYGFILYFRLPKSWYALFEGADYSASKLIHTDSLSDGAICAKGFARQNVREQTDLKVSSKILSIKIPARGNFQIAN